jgi:hypothetical protein
MSAFPYEHAKPGANVCGGGMNAEPQMTGRGRGSILGPPQLFTQADGLQASFSAHPDVAKCKAWQLLGTGFPDKTERS